MLLNFNQQEPFRPKIDFKEESTESNKAENYTELELECYDCQCLSH